VLVNVVADDQLLDTSENTATEPLFA